MGQNGETEEPGCDDENLNCEAKSSVRRRQTSRKTSKTENEKVNNNEHDLHRSTGKPSHICPIVHITMFVIWTFSCPENQVTRFDGEKRQPRTSSYILATDIVTGVQLPLK